MDRMVVLVLPVDVDNPHVLVVEIQNYSFPIKSICSPSIALRVHTNSSLVHH
jgi:hypothetical protein